MTLTHTTVHTRLLECRCHTTLFTLTHSQTLTHTHSLTHTQRWVLPQGWVSSQSSRVGVHPADRQPEPHPTVTLPLVWSLMEHSHPPNSAVWITLPSNAIQTYASILQIVLRDCPPRRPRSLQESPSDRRR